MSGVSVALAAANEHDPNVKCCRENFPACDGAAGYFFIIDQMKTIARRVGHRISTILGRQAAPRLDLLALLPKRGIGAEIGVHLGDFSKSLLHWSRPRKLFLIDPWRFEAGDEYKDSWYGGPRHTAQELEDRYQSVHRRFSRDVNSGRIVILRQTSEAALGGLEDASLDYVYIDGNHNYEFVRRDLELSLQKVRPGGYITGDDYRPDGWWKGGVKKAVDEFGWREKEVQLLWIKGNQFVFRRR